MSVWVKMLARSHDFKHFNASMMFACNENFSLLTICLIFEKTRFDSELILRMMNTLIVNWIRTEKRSRCNFYQNSMLFDSLHRDSLKYCFNSFCDFVLNNDFFIQRLNAKIFNVFAIIFSNVIDIEILIWFEWFMLYRNHNRCNDCLTLFLSFSFQSTK